MGPSFFQFPAEPGIDIETDMKLAAQSQELCVYAPDGDEIEALAVLQSELGWMAFAVRDGMLCGLVFGHASAARASRGLCRVLGISEGGWLKRRIELGDERRIVERLADALQRFAAGDWVEFRDVVLDERHLTPFGRRIVAACRRIPRGQTRTYGQLAAVCASPGAARAVGQVMARNRFPLVVPCHRVLGAGGSLGGFSAPQGLAMKRRLLALES